MEKVKIDFSKKYNEGTETASAASSYPRELHESGHLWDHGARTKLHHDRGPECEWHDEEPASS